MPNSKKARRLPPDLTSPPGAIGAEPALGALREVEARRHSEDLDREADRAVRAASALMDGEDEDERRRISERAYEIYLARGDREGSDVTDWLEAEREIRGGRR